MQVDPIKPTLKLPGSQHLNLKHENLLSNFAFNINLRRYSPVAVTAAEAAGGMGAMARARAGLVGAGAPNRPPGVDLSRVASDY